MPALALWCQAVRPFAFTVSVIPPILGALIALIENPGLNLDIFRFILAGIGCMSAHAGANLLSDFFDYRAEVDREGTFGSSGRSRSYWNPTFAPALIAVLKRRLRRMTTRKPTWRFDACCCFTV